MSQHKPTQPESQTIARRRLLKILGATSGVVLTSSIVPEKWTSPIVEVGYLPAHAQITGVVQVSSLRREFLGTPCVVDDDAPGNEYRISFNYSSPFGDVVEGTRLTQSVSFPDGTRSSFTVTLTSNAIGGDGSSGTISYITCTGFGPPENDSVTTRVSILTPENRVSNTESVTISRPVDAFLGAQKAGEVAP